MRDFRVAEKKYSSLEHLCPVQKESIALMVGCIPCKEVFGNNRSAQANSKHMYGFSFVIANYLKQKVKQILCYICRMHEDTSLLFFLVF